MTARLTLILLACAATAAVLAAPGEIAMPVLNGGFEDGTAHWTLGGTPPMGTLTRERAASGATSLKVVDATDKEGSDIRGERIAVPGAGVYELRGKYLGVSGSGLGMYVRLYDAAGTFLNGEESHLIGLGGTDKDWRSFAGLVYAPEGTVGAEIWVHSYMAAIVTGYVDDLSLVKLPLGDQPPWPGQYKLRPDQKDRLTAADVVGPDGIVYPNWTKCGVEGGIPTVAAFATVEKYGAKANDDADDSAALQAACDAAAQAGGGAVVLGAGTYQLDMPVTIRGDGVVIRGAGRDRTRLVFRYGLPAAGLRFFSLGENAKVGKGTRLELHCRPAGLMTMEILVDGVSIGQWTRSLHSGNTFAYARYGRDALAKVQPGSHTLVGKAGYQDGSEKTCQLPIVLDADYVDPTPFPSTTAALTFAGQGYVGDRVPLTADGARGALDIRVKDASSFRAGDCIVVDGPATERWKKLTRNACLWGTYRRYFVRVKSVAGNTLTLEQPLRIEFPVIDGSYVQRIVPLQRCGVEDFTIEQTEDLWISSAYFSQAWNCWARGVTARKCGRFPVYAGAAKFCEFRDCIFDDAWFKGGGGTAYGGWEHCSDCLLENVETFKLRHAPLFQWAASGCVIRKGVFHESDGQWHSGWTNENLFEQCVIECVPGNGAYGYGMWASPPEDTAHGPNGPRNVIYNCDTTSPRTGLWMGGMNENWLVLYNRFAVKAGAGVFAKTASFDHIIRGNVFILQDGKSPMVQLQTPDCVGAEITENRLLGGNGKFVAGMGKPAVLERNEAQPLAEAARPQPPTPSIYEWQLQHCR
ncbi:hypothetical protein LLH23_10045 [bacterium]|nr:hypothetical protein [bacterium]